MTAPAVQGQGAAAAPAAEVDGAISMREPKFLVIVGPKGSGKSVLARTFFEQFPGDRAVLDPTGDVAAALPEDFFRDVPPGYRGPFPKRDDERRATIRGQYRRSSRTYHEDMDHFIAMTLEHGRRTKRPVLLWIDEAGRVATRNKTLPHKLEAQEEGRHAHLFQIDCFPRPSNMEPLLVLQADYVYAFALPSPIDRQRLADLAGVDPRTFDEAMRSMPDYGYLRIDTRAPINSDRRLVVFPPLPEPNERATP